jgi:putative oxygen-independent coproporphyrinogen III oxidase
MTQINTRENNINSAYIHIPFCRRRCFYCDFPVSVVGDRLRGENSGTIQQYIQALSQEISSIIPQKNPLKTIFFGGGTPSLLSVTQLEQILQLLQQKFGIDKNAEISIEMDPGTFDGEHIKGYRDLGVNRISLGVQAFQTELLAICGRSHNLNDIFTAIDLIRKVEIPEFSLDLISGLPEQTLSQWEFSLKSAIDIHPTHISSYDLIIEDKTPFGKFYQQGANPLPTDDISAQMYKLADNILTAAGYSHYEISNYALTGHECKHNRVYWENKNYYGFGMGAASYTDNMRFTRPRTTKEYYQWVNNGCKIDVLSLSSQDILLETLMLGLRLAEGLNLQTLITQFGNPTINKVLDILTPHHQQGWVEINEQIKLTTPEGFLFSNTLLSDLFKGLE